MNVEELLHRVQGLLGRTINGTQPPEEKELFRVAAAALMFISETGRLYSFEDYLKFSKEDPPLVVASFKTRQEAETWLESHPEPPHGAHVLIAGEYHLVAYHRDRNIRSLPRLPVMEYYLEDLARNLPATPVASFETCEQAEAWLQSQPEPPKNVFVLVAGEPHVAVYHRLISQRTLYPLSVSKQPEKRDDAGQE
jgi:hypothetical protein